MIAFFTFWEKEALLNQRKKYTGFTTFLFNLVFSEIKNSINQ